MLQSSERVHFSCRVSHGYTAASFYHLFSGFFLFPLLFSRTSFTELAASMNRASFLQRCFRKSSATPAEFAPVIQVSTLFVVDPCTDGVRTPNSYSCFDPMPGLFFETTCGNPAERTNFNSQVHCVFSFKSSFYLSFLFSDKISCSSRQIFLVSLFTNTNPCIIAFFPMLLPSEAPCSHAI